MSKELLQQALDVLIKNNARWKELADSGDAGNWKAEDQGHYMETEDVIKAICEAIAKPVAPTKITLKPIGWIRKQDGLTYAPVIALYSDKPAPENSILPVEMYSRDQVENMLTAQPAPVAPRYPINPAEMREFIGSNFNSLNYGDSREVPSDNDRYSLSVHDLLSAAREWETYAIVPAPVAQAEPTSKLQWCKDCGEGVTGFCRGRPAACNLFVAQAEPLSDEQLEKLAIEDEFVLFCDVDEFIQIARAIEQAHGIKPPIGAQE